jgi:hypothetical protein
MFAHIFSFLCKPKWKINNYFLKLNLETTTMFKSQICNSISNNHQDLLTQQPAFINQQSLLYTVLTLSKLLIWINVD